MMEVRLGREQGRIELGVSRDPSWDETFTLELLHVSNGGVFDIWRNSLRTRGRPNSCPVVQHTRRTHLQVRMTYTNLSYIRL